MYSRKSVNRNSTNQRYVTRHPPRWVEILIDGYNRLDHAAITGKEDQRVSLCEHAKNQVGIAQHWQLAAVLGLPDWEPTAEQELLTAELTIYPLEKIGFFLKKARLCPPPCRRAFWPPRSNSRLCENCRQDSAYRKKLKAGREELRAKLLQMGWDEKAIADELAKQGYPPVRARRPPHQ